MTSTWGDGIDGGKHIAQRLCKAKPSQRWCCTKFAQRTRNSFVSPWRRMVSRVVLCVADEETKKGIMVCHNCSSQLIALFDWAQKVIRNGNQKRLLFAPQHVDGHLSTSTSWPNRGQQDTPKWKNTKKSVQPLWEAFIHEELDEQEQQKGRRSSRGIGRTRRKEEKREEEKI